jgi:DNA-binding response OmpR family regulator
VKLPPKCLRLLEMLMARPGHTLRREEIEIELWGDRQDLSDRLRNHTSVLRRALVAAGGRDPIITVHGIGLRLAPKP